MAQESQKNISWQVPDYQSPERPKAWYTAALILIVALLFSCFFTFENWIPVFLGYESNFLFALVIILGATIMIINENRSTVMIDIEIDEEGVSVGSNFYDYDEFRHFAVIYKPKLEIKALYLEFKNPIKPRISLPLNDLDPLEVRNYLVKYLDEDLDRTEPPLSEQLTSKLKL